MAYARKSPLPAGRISRVHSDETRQRIRAIKIIVRLQSFALSIEQEGQYADEYGRPVRAMTSLQVRASLALLDKVLPGLQTVAVSEAKTTTYVIRAPLEAEDYDEWMNLYGPSERKQAT